MEIQLDSEGHVRVNELAFVSILLLLIELVKWAEPTSLAVFDEAILIRVVTGVHSRPEGILVGFHDIELGAESIGRVGIAVPEAIRVVEFAILVHRGEFNKVDGRVTAALSLA